MIRRKRKKGKEKGKAIERSKLELKLENMQFDLLSNFMWTEN